MTAFVLPRGKPAVRADIRQEMTLPRIQPITPTWRKEPFDHPDWLFDVKYDGFRAISYIQRGRCNLVSRRGNVFARFDALGEQVASTLCRDVVAELGVDDAILDGEVITADETGRPQFYDLLRRTLSPGYVAFDLLWQRCRPAAFAPQRALEAAARDLADELADDHRGGFGRAPGSRAVRAHMLERS